MDEDYLFITCRSSIYRSLSGLEKSVCLQNQGPFRRLSGTEALDIVTCAADVRQLTSLRRTRERLKRLLDVPKVFVAIRGELHIERDVSAPEEMTC
jgi:hypothetical protein